MNARNTDRRTDPPAATEHRCGAGCPTPLFTLIGIMPVIWPFLVAMFRRRWSVSTSFMLAALRVLHVDASGAPAEVGNGRGRAGCGRVAVMVRTPGGGRPGAGGR